MRRPTSRRGGRIGDALMTYGESRLNVLQPLLDSRQEASPISGGRLIPDALPVDNPHPWTPPTRLKMENACRSAAANIPLWHSAAATPQLSRNAWATGSNASI